MNLIKTVFKIAGIIAVAVAAAAGGAQARERVRVENDGPNDGVTVCNDQPLSSPWQINVGFTPPATFIPVPPESCVEFSFNNPVFNCRQKANGTFCTTGVLQGNIDPLFTPDVPPVATIVANPQDGDVVIEPVSDKVFSGACPNQVGPRQLNVTASNQGVCPIVAAPKPRI
jgi:hypothetical protein